MTDEPKRLHRNELLSVCVGIVRIAISNGAYDEADYLLEMIQRDLTGGTNEIRTKECYTAYLS